MGSTSIIPQAFLIYNNPEYKEVLLPLILITGAVMEVLGVLSINFIRNKNIKLLTVSLSVISILSLCVIIYTKSFYIFLIANIIFRYISSVFYSILDLYCTSSIKNNSSDNYCNLHIAMQMLAIVLSPLLFSEFLTYDSFILSLLLSVSLVFLWSCFNIKEFNFSLEKSKPSLLQKLSKSEAVFFIFSICNYMVMTLYAGMVIFVAKDYYAVSNAVKIGGLAFFSFSLSSLSCMLLIQFALKMSNNIRSISILKSCFFVLGLTFLGISVLSFGKELVNLYIGSVLIGVSVGIYWPLSKKIMTKYAIKSSKLYIISFYNICPAISIVLAYLMLLLLDLIIFYFSFSYYFGFFFLLYFLLAIASIVLWYDKRFFERQRG
ncbi:hypothetical protein [uncultured Shewanella sp.]|uniref:hypothetical protein n=1 Tax=uncultured Shewanella sp. TaxID=173975 RepID=UPI00261A9CDE|nr:hypothetical protein [uncultured Shewanella sp.]